MPPLRSVPIPPSSDAAATPSDCELLWRVAAEERAALALLYERYSSLIYSLAYQMTSDAQTAEEVLQDAFVRVWKNASSYDPSRAASRTWLVRITRNLCLDRIRALKRRPQPDGRFDALLELPAAGGIGASWRDECADVRQAVRALEPEERRCLELSFFHGLTQREIAARLEHPLGTVKARIRRALFKLRETLSCYDFQA